MNGIRTRVAAALVATTLLSAACASGSGRPAAGSGRTTAPGATGSGGEDDPGSGGLYGGKGTPGSTGSTGAAGATGAADEASVSVSLSNYQFDPDQIEVAQGDVVAVRNGNPRTPHTFTVVGQDVDLELTPLQTETVTIDLAPGTYDLICRFHESLGMTATLEVT